MWLCIWLLVNFCNGEHVYLSDFVVIVLLCLIYLCTCWLVLCTTVFVYLYNCFCLLIYLRTSVVMYLLTCVFVYLCTCVFLYLCNCVLANFFCCCVLVYLWTCVLIYLCSCVSVYLCTWELEDFCYYLLTKGMQCYAEKLVNCSNVLVARGPLGVVLIPNSSWLLNFETMQLFTRLLNSQSDQQFCIELQTCISFFPWKRKRRLSGSLTCLALDCHLRLFWE